MDDQFSARPGDIAMYFRQTGNSQASPLLAQQAIVAALRQAGLLAAEDPAADERTLTEFLDRHGQLQKPAARRFGHLGGWA